jgi:hypothetical protein
MGFRLFTNSLYDGVSFTDINNGTAVGENGTIIRTMMLEQPGLYKQALQHNG